MSQAEEHDGSFAISITVPAFAGSEAGSSAMPSLFRFLVVVGLLGGLAYGAVFSLANFVTYQPREIVVTIPPNKFVKPY